MRVITIINIKDEISPNEPKNTWILYMKVLFGLFTNGKKYDIINIIHDIYKLRFNDIANVHSSLWKYIIIKIILGIKPIDDVIFIRINYHFPKINVIYLNY